MADLDDIQLCKIVGELVKSAEDYRDERSDDRIKANAFFDGESEDMQKYIEADKGRSRVVSRDVRSAVKKVLPSIFRTILGGDEIVEYQPVGEGDDDTAEQATDYVNYIAIPECNGRQAIEDAISDAIRLRNGIVKWWQEEKKDVKVSTHTGLDEMAFSQLVSDDDVEVLEHSERMETVETPGPDGMPMPQEIPVHDVKIKRLVTQSKPKIAAIPLENWLIHPDAIRMEDSPILGENCRLRRSDLVKMGYDKDQVWKLPAYTASTSDRETEEDSRRRDDDDDVQSPQRALDEIEYYDLLVRIDQDDDGIAELRRMVFAGGIKEECLLENTEWDEVNYADIVSERRPHQWEGNSVTDDTMDIETVKTVLLRQTLDNLYWQNNLQPAYQEGQITNPESVLNPQFGQPIIIAQGTNVKEAIQWSTVPMVADKSFSMLQYLDNEVKERTGISDASSGMAPDALQNMTAKASAMIEAAGIGQTEMMVRTIANCLKPVFRGLLKLIIQHQDKPRTIRLRNKWIEFDPRTWNADMDAEVNVGLGAGTRERDMMAMQQVMSLQNQILTSMGPEVGRLFVTEDNFYNALSKVVQSAGLKTVGLYFTKPEEGAVDKAMQARSQQPSPEQIKAETTLQVEDKRTQREVIKTQAQTQAKREEAQMKAEVDINREREQRDADLATNLAEMNRQAAIDGQKIEADNASRAADRQLERDGMALDYQMHAEDIESREQVAERNAYASVQKAQAASIGKAFEKNDRAAQQ